MSDQLAELARQYGGAPVGAPPPDFKASNVPVDARGVPLDAPRDARGQIISSHDEAPGTLDQLNAMLGPLAHPQTLTDFARLLTLPVDTVRKAAASALALAASRGPVGDAISATGRGLEKAGTALDKPLSVGGAVEMFRDPVKGTAALVAPAVARGAGRVLQRAGAFVRGAAPAAAEVPPTIGEAAEATSAAPAAAAPARPGPDGLLVGRPGGNPALPDQKLLNELAIQARRAGVTLTPETEQAAIDAVGKGATPADAVKAVATPAAAAPAPPAAAAPVWTPAKLRLTAEESKVAAQLIQAGKTDHEVQTAIETARKFQQRYGTPTPTAAEKRFGKAR